jgi:hypothetical protein
VTGAVLSEASVQKQCPKTKKPASAKRVFQKRQAGGKLGLLNFEVNYMTSVILVPIGERLPPSF